MFTITQALTIPFKNPLLVLISFSHQMKIKSFANVKDKEGEQSISISSKTQILS